MTVCMLGTVWLWIGRLGTVRWETGDCLVDWEAGNCALGGWELSGGLGGWELSGGLGGWGLCIRSLGGWGLWLCIGSLGIGNCMT